MATGKILGAACPFYRPCRCRGSPAYRDCQKDDRHLCGLLRELQRAAGCCRADSLLLSQKNTVADGLVRFLYGKFCAIACLSRSFTGCVCAGCSCCPGMAAPQKVPGDTYRRRLVYDNPATSIQPACHQPCCCRSLPVSPLFRTGFHCGCSFQSYPSAAQTGGFTDSADSLPFGSAYLQAEPSLA